MLPSYFKIEILVKCREYSTLGHKGLYSKNKTSWHLWAEHEASFTMLNYHLRAVFFVMESNIAYNLESK